MRCSHRKNVSWIALAAMVLMGVFPVLGQEPARKPVSPRAERRAFYTAPPVIPHAVDGWQTGETCLTCHGQIRQWRGGTSMLTPHPKLSNCQQCHVRQVAPAWQAKSKFVGSVWLGLTEPGKGTRATQVAPPTIPHRYLMRENCIACHLTVHSNRSTMAIHPKRSNCQQCHVMPKANMFILAPNNKATKQTAKKTSGGK